MGTSVDEEQHTEGEGESTKETLVPDQPSAKD